MNIDDQEVIDEANLVLPKEIYEEEDSGDLPIRYLDHFSIFDDETNLLISLDGAEDPKFGKNPYFVGHVSAKWISEEDEDFDEHMAGEGKDKKFNGQEEADEGDRTLINLMEVKVRSSAIVEIWESMEPERDGLVSEQRSISSIRFDIFRCSFVPFAQRNLASDQMCMVYSQPSFEGIQRSFPTAVDSSQAYSSDGLSRSKDNFDRPLSKEVSQERGSLGRV